jgi:hypothetical protein
MKSKTQRVFLAMAGAVLVVSTAPAGGTVAERPQMQGLLVPDNSLTVDGQRADWERAGMAFTQGGVGASDASHLEFAYPDRGGFGGPSDCSYTLWAAMDAQYLYLYAEVRDQVLANEAGKDEIFFGDDFEVFIDANPPADRFAKKNNENVRQFIFLPAWVHSQQPAGLIFQAEKNPGVKMASRLKPDGYALEVAIPKALFPAWQAHPESDSVGFDVVMNEADAPGLDGTHPTVKYAMFLLSAGFHPGSPEKLGTLDFQPAPPFAPMLPETAKPTPSAVLTALSSATVDPVILAQQVLDCIGDEQAAELATAAWAHPSPAVRKAGLYLLAKRPALSAPVGSLTAFLARPTNERGDAQYDDHDLRTYAMMALALRGKLPVNANSFGFYTRLAAAQALELTYIWCLGVNGDRAAVPYLGRLLYDSNLRVRMKAAIALGQLGDPAAVPALEEMAANEAHAYGRKEAQAALERIKQGTTTRQ